MLYRIVKIGIFSIVCLYFWIVFAAVLINDDYMALYTTWRMSLGDVANVDFNVDSYTMLFYLLAPLFTLFGERVEVLYLYRLLMLFSLFFITIQLRLIFRKYVSEKNALITIFLLLIALPMYSRGLDIRPDMIILLIWLQIIIILAKYTTSDKSKMLLIGLLIGLSFLFKFKSLIIIIPVGIYLMYFCYQARTFSSLLGWIIMIVGGFITALVLYAVLFGVREFAQLMITSTELLGLSASGGINTPGLKLQTLKHFFKQDVYYWILFFFGLGISSKGFRSYSSEALLRLIAIFLLIAFSLILNPHYHAYNLVTLYPLMSIFIAISVQWISDRLKQMPAKKAAIYLSALLLILIRPMAGIASYPLRNSKEHQIELHRFIQENTTADQAVFAYEGIGLFRPSTYHWRTSAIMLKNYYDGEYNVWREISETKPILIILSYRLPNWLMKQDKQQLMSTYTLIAPHVMTLGIQTQSYTSRFLLKSGYYQVLNSKKQKSEVDGRKVENKSIHWLESGIHSLKSPKGTSVLRWYFSNESLEQLIKSNPKRYPYLIPPQ